MTETAAAGPGAILSGWLDIAGFTHREGCGCKELATKMDQWGPDGCQRRLGVIVAGIQLNAQHRGVVAPTLAIRAIVRLAIARARIAGV